MKWIKLWYAKKLNQILTRGVNTIWRNLDCWWTVLQCLHRPCVALANWVVHAQVFDLIRPVNSNISRRANHRRMRTSKFPTSPIPRARVSRSAIFLIWGLLHRGRWSAGRLINFGLTIPTKDLVLSPPEAEWGQFRFKLCVGRHYDITKHGARGSWGSKIYILGWVRNLISTASGPTINNLMMPNLMVRGFIISLGCRSVVTFVWLTRGEQPCDPAMFLRRFKYDFLRERRGRSSPYPRPI